MGPGPLRSDPPRPHQIQKEQIRSSGLWCVFEDPDADARTANIFWRREACRDVLPLAISDQSCGSDHEYFRLAGLSCRVITHRDENTNLCHVLFAQDGRFFQLEICGAVHLEDGLLLTPVLPAPALRSARILGIRRLADLMSHGYLRPSLYPPERRGPRLMRVVQALDGALAGASQRDIGIALFGLDRVEREWHHPHNYLRDHVRRAIGHGRRLMAGGYRKLLA